MKEEGGAKSGVRPQRAKGEREIGTRAGSETKKLRREAFYLSLVICLPQLILKNLYFAERQF